MRIVRRQFGRLVYLLRGLPIAGFHQHIAHVEKEALEIVRRDTGIPTHPLRADCRCQGHVARIVRHQGSGSTTARINVDFADGNFSKSSVTTLSVDLQDTSFNAIPFSQTEASDSINGYTPFYNFMPDGTRVNAGAATCDNGGQSEAGVASTRCDLHLQTDGTYRAFP